MVAEEMVVLCGIVLSSTIALVGRQEGLAVFVKQVFDAEHEIHAWDMETDGVEAGRCVPEVNVFHTKGMNERCVNNVGELNLLRIVEINEHAFLFAARH